MSILGDKKGQYYFFAAIIIVAVVASSIAIVNYSRVGSNFEIESIAEELSVETQKVLDYDVSHTGNEEIQTFGEEYSSYRDNVEIYFVIGEDSNVNAYKYSKGEETEVSGDVEVEGDKIIFTLDDTEHEFDLSSGTNFYFLVTQEIDGDSYVVTG